MKVVLVAGVLMMALFVAVLSAVNAECPKTASGIADTRPTDARPAS
jgi:hypothetical protein